MSYTDRSASWRTSTLHSRSCAPRSTGGDCTQCPPGPTGQIGPTGPAGGGGGGTTGPTGPAGSGSAATWSQYAATRDVSFGCFQLRDVSGINFCDGTYIGHGASFDISSGERIVIKSADDVTITTKNGGSISHINGANGASVYQRIDGTATDITMSLIPADPVGDPPATYTMSMGRDDRTQVYLYHNDTDTTQNLALLNCAGGIATVGDTVVNNTRIDVNDASKIITATIGAAPASITSKLSIADNNVIQLGELGITAFPTIKFQSGTDPLEYLNLTYNSTAEKGIISTGGNGQLLFQGGSSFRMESGGTTDIISSDAVTIQANDSSMLMNADITMTAGTDVRLFLQSTVPKLISLTADNGTSVLYQRETTTVISSPAPTLMFEDTVNFTQPTLTGSGNNIVVGAGTTFVVENISAGGGNLTFSAPAGNINIEAAGSAITIRDEEIAAKVDVRASRDGTDADTAYVNLDVDNLESSIGCQNGATFAQYVASGTSGNAEISTTGEIKLTIGGAIQARLAGGGNIGVGGSGSDGSVFLLKNDDTSYGSFNYNSGSNTLNVDNGGSGISVGASGIKMTPVTGVVEIVGDSTVPATATLTFTDTSTTVPTVNMSVSNDGFGFGYSQLSATAGLLSASSGAVEGVAIGTNGSENVVIGYGLPLRISNSATTFATDYIQIETDPSTSLGRAKIVQTEEVNIDTPLLTLPTIPLATKPDILYYDTATKAVSYGTAFPAITVQTATGTIALTEAMNRATYILTGTSATQSFSQAGLVGVAAGWTVYLRNGNNATGLTQDITISIPAGNTTLHAPTGTTNSSFILLYWNGSALVAYR